MVRYIKKCGIKIKLLPAPIPNQDELLCPKCGTCFDSATHRRACIEACGHVTCLECICTRLSLREGCEQCAKLLMPPPQGLPIVLEKRRRKQQVLVLMPKLSKTGVVGDEDEFPEIENISLSALPVLERADMPEPASPEEENEMEGDLELEEENQGEKVYQELKPVVLPQMFVNETEPELIDLAFEEELEAAGIQVVYEDVDESETGPRIVNTFSRAEFLQNVVDSDFEEESEEEEEDENISIEGIENTYEENLEAENIQNQSNSFESEGIPIASKNLQTQETEFQTENFETEENQLAIQNLETPEPEILKNTQTEIIKNCPATVDKSMQTRVLFVRLERLPESHSAIQKYKLAQAHVRVNTNNSKSSSSSDVPKLRRKARTLYYGKIDETMRSSAKGQGIQNCQYCKQTFNNRSALGLHLTQKHSEHRPHPCDICNWPFDTARNLAMHKLTHTNERPYKCDLCDSAFNRNFTLKKHMDKIHGLVLPKKKRPRVEPPRRSHSPKKTQAEAKISTEKIVTSPVPSSGSSGIGSEKENLEEMDTDSNLDPELAQITRKRRYNRRKPKRKPVSAEHRFCCSHCDMAFNRKHKLGEHLKEKHRDKRPYCCDLCGWSFAQKNKLLLHRITHTIDRPFKCKQCESTFNRKYSLERHIRIMHLKKPRNCEAAENKPSQKKTATCPYCQVEFENREVLGKHMKAEHAEKRPYICQQCHWPFARRKHLVAHLKTHSTEKPHECRMCDAKFNRRFSLERHMDHVHGVRIRLLPEEAPQGDEYCPECQSLFEESSCVKVAYSKCGHVSCIDCVIRAELGCGQCTTDAAKKKQDGKLDSPTKENGKYYETRSTEKETARRIIPELTNIDIIANLEVPREKKSKTAKILIKDGNKLICCKYCDWSIEFKNKKELGVHMNKEHADERPYPCDTCQWPFTTLRDLERHQLTHTNEKPFKCDSCSDSFNRKSTRDRHVEKKHLNWRRI